MERFLGCPSIENAKGVDEETRTAEESKFNNALARLEGEKNDALAKVRVWQLVASSCLIVLLTISASLLLRRRKGTSGNIALAGSAKTFPHGYPPGSLDDRLGHGDCLAEMIGIANIHVRPRTCASRAP